MKIDQISRMNDSSARDVVKDVMYIFDKVISGEIDIRDDYTVSLLQKNWDITYHISLILSRLNVVSPHTISEIRASIDSGVAFSDRDYHEDLANGDDVKRSRKMQINRSANGKYKTYSWIINNLANKKGNVIWEITHNGRMWKANIPRKHFENKNSLSIACDPKTGEPSKKSILRQYFEEVVI
jgi:hypothetical protein